MNLAKLFGIESPAENNDDTPAPDVLKQLEAAHAAKAVAVVKLKEATAAVAAEQAVIDAADIAQAQAESADEAGAEEYRRRVVSGAKGPFGDSDALTKAADAERAVIAAKKQAEWARKALPEMQQLQEDAAIAVRQADEAINNAINAVIKEILEPDYQNVADCMAKAYPSVVRIHAAAGLLYGRWETFSDTGLSLRLSARLASLMLRDPTDAELAPTRMQLADYARSLAKSPDASA